MAFIVQGKPREPEGIVKVIRQTRKEALETANDFLNEGFPFVTIVGDGHAYTVKEFATTVGNDELELHQRVLLAILQALHRVDAVPG